jgi:hypothetical protein
MPRATVNPKALALFLGTVARARRRGSRTHRSRHRAARRNRRARHHAGDALGWGYPFGWQSRHFWAPPHLPNAVVTSTVAWHLFEYADRARDDRARQMALSGARFLASCLTRSEANGGEAIAYTAKDRTQVINVSALAARALARAASADTSPRLRDIASYLLRPRHAARGRLLGLLRDHDSGRTRSTRDTS